MTKSYKKNYSIIRIIGMLCFALVFSCTNITNTDVITHEKKTLAEPTFNYVTGDKVSYGTKIELRYSPNDAFLWYTTDGTEPEQGEDNFYDPHKGIILTEAVTTITVRLYHSNYHPSKVVGHTYNISIDPPVIEAKDGKTTITTLDEISITHGMENADIYYTTDGTEPNEDMEEYEKPFTISKTGTVTVKAIAVVGGIKSKAEKVFTVIGADEAYLDTLSVKDKEGKEWLTNFEKTQTSYDFGVKNEVSEVNITATSADCDVVIQEFENGIYSDIINPIALVERVQKIIKVTVTSKTDAEKKKEYLVNITRAPIDASNDATLSSIKLDSDKGKITLTPDFSKDTEKYEAIVEYEINSVSLSFNTTHEKANAKILEPEKLDALQVGENTLGIEVTAEDAKTIKTYTIKVIREDDDPDPKNANLKSLSIGEETISSPIKENITKTLSKSTVVIKATPEIEGSVVKINGKGTSLEVEVPSVVNIEVTAKDCVTKKTYTLNLESTPIPPPDTPELVSLTVNGETIGVSSSMSYTTSTSTTASIVATVKNATNFTINGIPATNGIAVPVTISDDASKSGNLQVTIVLVGENNKTISYSLSLTYKAPITDKIILHAYDKIYLWAWDDSKNYSGGNWPGVKMADEGNKWYGHTLENVKVCNIIFSNGGDDSKSSPHGEPCEEGEWWYKDGKWTDYNPDRPSTPVITASVKSGTYLTSQTVELKGSNFGDVIYYTTDGSTPDQSSQVYSSAITISSDTTLKAVGFNAEANPQMGNVYEFRYVIDADADLEAPVIAPSLAPGRYENPVSVTFSFADNKGVDGVTAYYTTDNSTPTESSKKYTGESIPIGKDENKTIRVLAVDASGNKTVGTYYYSVGALPEATRWDPRQESIYFLLTARWFDGDKSNTVGDQWCSSEEDPAWRGDFKGLVEKLDYIKALGFTCIWITPVVQNRSPLCYHGYHAWDMYKEDARLVSDGYDFQRVIDEAHKRGIKICLDIVLQHSGRFGLKDFAEIKYNRDPLSYPVPVGWENFTYDEDAYRNAYKVANKTGVASVQKFPNGWEYDGLKSPGVYPDGWKIDGVDVGGQVIPPSADVIGDVRPFTKEDVQKYSYLLTNKNKAGVSPYQWPTTESYQLTIDTGNFAEVNGNVTANYTYDQFVASPGRHIHGWSNGFNDSGMFDKYPDANLRSIHEDCPDLNTESSEVQEYVINAYNRYIDMGVDMFRVDTVMHVDKKTLNDHFWPAFFDEAATEKAKAARGGGDFFMFGEVANFVNNLMQDKPAPIRQCNYTWDNTVCPDSTDLSMNHALDGNNYRKTDYSHKTVPGSDYHVSTIDIVGHNGFCDGYTGAYGRTHTDGAYNDATYLTWYTDSHDYGPNKGTTRWHAEKGDFAAAWSMLFTFRGIPIVYYGSEIQFAAGKPNDWPGSTENTLNETGRAYFGEHLEGNVTATDFGEYTASGEVATTLSSDLSKHLRDLNKIRLAVPALQMGQYSKEGHNGGWAGYKRRYTGTNKITGEKVDSYALVGVGAGTHSWSGVLDGEYVNVITGATVSASGGSIKCAASGSDGAALVVLVKTGLATPAPGKVAKESPFLGF